MSENGIRVDNIFDLLHRFAAREDQITAAFGFMLKNNTSVLRDFLGRLDIGQNELNISRNKLNEVDIETQVPYGLEDRPDLRLALDDSFLIIVESKIRESGAGIAPGSKTEIAKQLKKYSNILKRKKPQYGNRARLVWVSKYPVENTILAEIREAVGLSAREFYCFSWQELVDVVKKHPKSKRELTRLFEQYIGDTMDKCRVIERLRIEDVVEVLVCFTTRDFWDLTLRKRIAVQRNSAPDAMYIAFLRTQIGEGKEKRSAITHIAKVKETHTFVRALETYRDFPKLLAQGEKKEANFNQYTHKRYVLEEPIALATELPLSKGENKGQSKFSTTMSELLRAKSVGDIRTAKRQAQDKR